MHILCANWQTKVGVVGAVFVSLWHLCGDCCFLWWWGLVNLVGAVQLEEDDEDFASLCEISYNTATSIELFRRIRSCCVGASGLHLAGFLAGGPQYSRVPGGGQRVPLLSERFRDGIARGVLVRRVWYSGVLQVRCRSLHFHF